ncbi:MAG: YXWGXW repeat-containing protein [Burkholderiales bacterium]|nr:YXWGXW repeat-containing protein [Burkholderiales bacterium]
MTQRLASPLLILTLSVLSALAGCAVQVAPARIEVAPPPPVVSVYVEPPLVEPEPIVVGWAPPPMLVEPPPPMPFGGAVWIGGYWVWQGRWVWAAGRWAPVPRPGYAWVSPYYENRDGFVVFVAGHWCAPGVVFVPPPPTLRLQVAVALAGVTPGPRPIGPPGVFVPAPPGSRPGLIVPAPIGTAPAVVVGAPPIVHEGMRIQARVVNVSRVTNITNETNVTIIAPASATASGRAFESRVPAAAPLAAAQRAYVHAPAPAPIGPPPVAARPVGSMPVEARRTASLPAEAKPIGEPPAAARPMAEDRAVRREAQGGPAAMDGPAARTPAAQRHAQAEAARAQRAAEHQAKVAAEKARHAALEREHERELERNREREREHPAHPRE